MKISHQWAVILFLAASAPGMAQAQGSNNLTAAQLQAIKAAIVGDPVLAAFPNTADGNFEVAAALNTTAVPDYWVWRSFVPDTEIYEATTADGTSWSWPVYIARSVAERSAWDLMVRTKQGINPSLANVRTAVADIFSGAGGLPQRTHLLAIARRRARLAERILAAATPNGVGTRGSTANPDTMMFEGSLTYADVQQARDLP